MVGYSGGSYQGLETLVDREGISIKDGSFPSLSNFDKESGRVNTTTNKMAGALGTFAFRINYLKGEENKVADALSRNMDINAEVQIYAVELFPREFLITKDEILQAGQLDELYQQLLQDELMRAQLGITRQGEILKTMEDKIYVPMDQCLRYKLILEYHDRPLVGHWDARRTLQLLQQHFYWPNQGYDVNEVVETCDLCQCAQIAKTRDQAPIRYIEAQYPWEVITIDFVSGFAPTKRKHTAICVICDRFTRMVHLESCLDPCNGQRHRQDCTTADLS